MQQPQKNHFFRGKVFLDMVDRKRLQMISIGGPWPTAWPLYLRGRGGTQGGERGSRHFLATEKMARHTASGRALSLAGHTAFDRVAPRVEVAVRAAGLGFRRADWGARTGPFPGALLGVRKAGTQPQERPEGV